jgi:hypothetical protein
LPPCACGTPLRHADQERARRTGLPRAQAALDAVEQERRVGGRTGASAEGQAGARGSADGGPGQAQGQGAAPSAGLTGRLMLDLAHAGAAAAPAPSKRPAWPHVLALQALLAESLQAVVASSHSPHKPGGRLASK